MLLKFLEKCQGCPRGPLKGICGLSSLPAGLGVPVWERPPLGWVLSPVVNSRLIRGLGWYSLLGWDEACLILHWKEKGMRAEGHCCSQFKSKNKSNKIQEMIGSPTTRPWHCVENLIMALSFLLCACLCPIFSLILTIGILHYFTQSLSLFRAAYANMHLAWCQKWKHKTQLLPMSGMWSAGETHSVTIGYHKF
jgi:hypothetical protein